MHFTDKMETEKWKMESNQCPLSPRKEGEVRCSVLRTSAGVGSWVLVVLKIELIVGPYTTS